MLDKITASSIIVTFWFCFISIIPRALHIDLLTAIFMFCAAGFLIIGMTTLMIDIIITIYKGE